MMRQVLFSLVAAAAIISVGNFVLADVVTDYSGNDNHAQSYGDVLNVGDLTQALVFDGDADYISTPGFSDPMSAFTIAGWVQISDNGDPGWDNTMFGNPNWKGTSPLVSTATPTDFAAVHIHSGFSTKWCCR